MDVTLPVGTSSLRRELQFKKLYPEMKVEMVRGNLVSRLKKLDEGKYSALILAAAGLKRLGLSRRIYRYFSCEEMVPAAGQGILAVQGRRDKDYAFLEGFFDEDARDAALAERSFVRTLGGSCFSPAAAYAVCEGEKLTLTGLYDRRWDCAGDLSPQEELSERSGGLFSGQVEMSYTLDRICGSRREAEKLGRELAERMRGKRRR